MRVLRVLDQWSRQSPLLEVGSQMSGVTRDQAFDRVWNGVVIQDFIEGINEQL